MGGRVVTEMNTWNALNKPMKVFRCGPDATAAVAVVRRDSTGEPYELGIGARVVIAAPVMLPSGRSVGRVDGDGQLHWERKHFDRPDPDPYDRAIAARYLSDGAAEATLNSDGTVRAVRLGPTRGRRRRD